MALSGSLLDPRGGWHTATLLQDGRVLVIGGTGEGQFMHRSTELFDPSTDTWSSPGSAP
jgi:hypothetical protein